MSTEARKIHLIGEMLKVNNDKLLSRLEGMLLKEKKAKPSARDFVGLISKKDAQLMTSAISVGCEQINADDWK